MRFSLTAAFLGVLVHTTIAAPSSDTVLTPVGYRASNTFHLIPEGGRVAHVGSDIHIFDKKGNVVEIATPTTSTAAPVESNWVTYATWANNGSSPISLFQTTWTVPPAPTTWNGQTIFLFNAMASPAGDEMVFTALQYGPSAAGGGEFWSVSFWLFTERSIPSSAFGTPAIGVAEGIELFGSIEFQEGGFPDFTYNVAFHNVPGEPLTLISTLKQLTTVHEALAAVAVTKPSEYPAGPIVFSDITIEVIDGTAAPVSWSVVNTDDPADGIETTIDVDGPFGGVITITF
ncbi:hypothetical protein B0H17DRAFT_1088145 [Mycena rosella]|uniref:Uncharacterized protein n=1 Tax=Mycena rosella TaxID=1033263 RepID=A0AAD7CYE8_MYCRO|nr:hypothetical protein B0H17DRAFT_1088145 [Mycena rosella]